MKGKLTLVDQKSVKNSEVIYFKQYLVEPEIKRVKVSNSGKFKIKIADKDQYKFIFAHPDYEPQGVFLDLVQHDEYELKATLDRYAVPDMSKITVVTELDNFSRQKGIPLTKDEDEWTAVIKTDQKTLKYQLLAGFDNIIAFDTIDDVDGSGNYIYRVKVQNGEAHIKYSVDDKPFREGASSGNIVNVKNATVPIGVSQITQLMMETIPMIKDPVTKEVNTEIVSQVEERVSVILGQAESHIDSLYLISTAQNYFIRHTDVFAIPDEFWELADDPYFLLNHPLNAYMIQRKASKTIPYPEDKTDKEAVKETVLKRAEYLQSFVDLDGSGGSKMSLYSLIPFYYLSYPELKEKRNLWFGRAITDLPGSYAALSGKNGLKMAGMEGEVAPAFSLDSRFRKKVQLSDYKGKFVLLDFWGRGCGPCVAEIPNMKKIYASMDKSKIEFVSIAIDMNPKVLKEYTEKREMEWVQLSADGYESKVAKDYGIYFLPNLFLVNPEGLIVQMNKDMRGEKLKETLDSYLAGI